MAERRICSIPDCGKRHKGRGYCDMHLLRLKNSGSLDKKERGRPPCVIDGCNLPNAARGWCKVHYGKWRSFGDPLGRGSKTPRGEPITFLLKSIAEAKPDECILWPYNRVGLGYGRIHINDTPFLVHRLACEIVHGQPPLFQQAAHSCGAHSCINWHHVRWATRIENSDDKVLQSRTNRGERSSTVKLTREQVIEMRGIWDRREMTQVDLGKKYGVATATAGAICRRQIWRWLPERDHAI